MGKNIGTRAAAPIFRVHNFVCSLIFEKVGTRPGETQTSKKRSRTSHVENPHPPPKFGDIWGEGVNFFSTPLPSVIMLQYFIWSILWGSLGHKKIWMSGGHSKLSGHVRFLQWLAKNKPKSRRNMRFPNIA